MATLGRYMASLRACGVGPTDRVAVALSGGPDSLALAGMTAWWHALVRGQHAPVALVVDHRLRPESAEEALAVAAQARQLGMQARVLTLEWPEGPPAAGACMAAAREARYAALLRACGEGGRGHLLLAHHADDQAETALLRVLHASGVLGLACMPRIAHKPTEWGPVALARPLLGFRKAELERYCQRAGLRYVVDPTNAQLSHQRNRIRHAMQRWPTVAAAQAAAAAAAGGGEEGPRDAAGPGLDAGSPPGSLPVGGEASPLLLDDLLLVQRRCEAAMLQQQAQGEELLRRAVLRTSCPALPCAPAGQPVGPSPPRKQREAGDGERPGRGGAAWRRRRDPEASLAWAQQRPWYVDWTERLAQVSDLLGPLPYAVLDAQRLRAECAGEAVAVGALSRVLRAVSGSKYPPPLATVVQLRQALAGGALIATFMGGGCLLRRLARSKGRYVVCVAQQDQGRVEELLQQLPPIVNAFLLAKREGGEQPGVAVGKRRAAWQPANARQRNRRLP